jgi:hypothetical protein
MTQGGKRGPAVAGPNFRPQELRPDNDRRRAGWGRAGRLGRINRPSGRCRSAAAAIGAPDKRQDGRRSEQGQYDSIAKHGNTSGEGRHVRVNKPSRP